MDEVAIRFPELRIVMAHLGHPWQADTVTVIRKHPHVYADVSANFYRPWSFYSAMRIATEWNVLDKLLLGSDYPIATPAETIAGLRALNEIPRRSGLPEIPEAAIEAIITRDSLALLGLDRPR
jgi:predicted TIM-barrel fold metal-dependent hydrolase